MARKSILVVDDAKKSARDFRLIGEGYDVTTASSGEAAMKFVAADRRFDLFWPDLKMTGMSGLELLELTDFIKSIIAILLTAHGTADCGWRSAFGRVWLLAKSLCERENCSKPFPRSNFDARFGNRFRFAGNG